MTGVQTCALPISLLKIGEIDETVEEVGFIALILGFISSAITSYFAVSALLGLIKQQKFHYFTPYCVILGMFLIYSSLF